MIIEDYRAAIKTAFGSVDEEQYVDFCEAYWSGYFYYNTDICETVEWSIDTDQIEESLHAYNRRVGVDFLPDFKMAEFIKENEFALWFPYLDGNDQVVPVCRIVRAGYA